MNKGFVSIEARVMGMIYKGGPKNYSKKDWKMFGYGTLIFAILFGIIKVVKGDTYSPPSQRSSVSAEALAGAKRAGYKGAEAQEVAEAADRLCAASGEC